MKLKIEIEVHEMDSPQGRWGWILEIEGGHLKEKYVNMGFQDTEDDAWRTAWEYTQELR